MEDGTAFCTKCGARQETPDQPSAQGQVVRFSNSPNVVLDLSMLVSVLFVVVPLTASFFGRSMHIPFLVCLYLIAAVVNWIWVRRHTYLQLEQDCVSGVWIVPVFFVWRKAEAFRIPYQEIENICEKNGAEGVFLTVQGKTRQILIERGAEAEELIYQRKF